VAEFSFTSTSKDTVYRIIDVGGQRSERKKWMHHFEDVDLVLFLVALSEYDQALYEDGSVNRLQEALDLFHSICQSQWFTRTAVQLVFNKTDLFREKLKHSPLETYFPDFLGRQSVLVVRTFTPWSCADCVRYRWRRLRSRP
jgi:guanine nucleotide-binding protein subunit alpha